MRNSTHCWTCSTRQPRALGRHSIRKLGSLGNFKCLRHRLPAKPTRNDKGRSRHRFLSKFSHGGPRADHHQRAHEGRATTAVLEGATLGRRPVTVDVAKAHKMRQEGLGLRPIAKKLGISVNTLQKAL